MTEQGWMSRLEELIARAERLLPQPVDRLDWASTQAARWQSIGSGGALRKTVPGTPVSLDLLVGIERQRTLFEENLEQFVQGAPSNHVLLWGARGSGKSSLVRGALAVGFERGLRAVQVSREDLATLPELIEQLRTEPYRFVILCDDLSFEAGETGYKSLKSLLDGALQELPEHILLIATSNRRHLLPEYESENLGAKIIDGELHYGEAVEEKVSLADRFGLWISFHPFSQDRYLEAVDAQLHRYAAQCGLRLPDPEIWRQEAIRFGMERGRRCGRTAEQFARAWSGRHLIEVDLEQDDD